MFIFMNKDNKNANNQLTINDLLSQFGALSHI